VSTVIHDLHFVFAKFEWPTYWTGLSIVIGVGAWVAAYFNMTQASAAEDQAVEAKRQSDAANEMATYAKEQVEILKRGHETTNIWSQKHAEAAKLVMRTNHQIPIPKEGTMWGWNYVFSDDDLWNGVTTYIVERDIGGGRLGFKALAADQFLLPSVQTVIQKTLDTIESFKIENPDIAKKLGLLRE
jgi:hypothetical protein